MSDADTTPYAASTTGSTPDSAPGSAHYSTPEETRPPRNWFGLSSLIAGLVALLGSAIPVLNYLSGFLAIAGIVLGVIALLVKDRRRGQGIAGIVISAIALILSIILAIVYTVGAVRWIVDQTEAGGFGVGSGGADTVEVTYEVDGNSNVAAIKYTDYADGRPSSEILTSTSLPFTETITIPAGDDGDLDDFGLLAQSEGGALSCRITVDGTVVDEETSSGTGAFVSCNAGDD